jgi:hypothetical protein
MARYEQSYPLGFEQVTGLSSAKGLTVPDRATRALITCDTQNVRWRDDGTSPTAAIGIRMLPSPLFLMFHITNKERIPCLKLTRTNKVTGKVFSIH